MRIILLCTVLLTHCYSLDPDRVHSPFYEDGRYQNLYDDREIVEKGLHTVIYWKLFGAEDPPAVDPLPQDPPDLQSLRKDDFYPPEGTLRILWLGHSTTWLAATLQGRTYHLVMDPIFGDVLTRPRIIPLPLEKKEIPAADVVLVSHAHRDHLDEDTLHFLANLNSRTTLYLPSGMAVWAEEEGFPRFVVQEWWETRQDGPFEIQFVPAQHWSKMGINDTLQFHWGGYWISIGNRNIFFAGDTAYSPHFKDIRQKRQERLDLAIMPIGAFKPRWFMKPAHVNVPEALEASSVLQAIRMVPVHWGTFDLGDDAPRESSLLLQKHMDEGRIPEGLEVINWKPGQYLDLSLSVE